MHISIVWFTLLFSVGSLILKSDVAFLPTHHSETSTTHYFPTSINGNWTYLNDGLACPATLPGTCMQGRHEAAYVQVGDKFYLLGGRENSSNVNIYDPSTDTWSVGATPPILLHHFQAINYDGLIYVVAGFTGNFPSEPPLTHIYIYNPLKDNWIQGASIPTARQRGSAGVVIYQNKIYVVSGNILGHKGETPSGEPTHVTWLDEFDPTTNTWTILPDAPRARDHFQVAVINNKLYAVAGRRSNHLSTNFQQTFANTEAKVDVYDFATQTWATLSNDLPTQRAGNTVAVLGNELLVIGGESLAQGSAHNQNEALNTTDGTWRTLTPLQRGRHGTQAIVNNGGVYVAAGSPNRGGGNTYSQEVFFLGSSTSPTLTPITAGNLNPNTLNINFGQVSLGQTKQQSITLSNQSGTQGIIIQTIELQNGGHPDFELEIPFTLPIHLRPGGGLHFTAKIISSIDESKTATIQIEHQGANSTVTIPLSAQPNPLAVRMSRFEAKRTSDTEVRLTWETDWEQDNKGFEIERSENGRNFQKIGFVDGYGNQAVRKNYQFEDKNALQSYYYRLKQIDWVGTYDYSPIKYVEGNEQTIFWVYPNPNSGQIHWQPDENLLSNETIMWKLADQRGLLIAEGKDVVKQMKQRLEYHLHNAPAQVFHLYLQVGRKRYYQKIVKR